MLRGIEDFTQIYFVLLFLFQKLFVIFTFSERHVEHVVDLVG